MSGPWEKYKTAQPSGPWTKYGGGEEIEDSGPGPLKRAWDVLSIPEKMSRQGWQEMQDRIPADIQTPTNIPGLGNIPAKTGAAVIKEIAPGFVDPVAVAMGGIGLGARAARQSLKVIRPVAKAIANAAESASGLQYQTPGILTDAFENRRLITGRGTDEAGGLYDELMDKGRIRKEFKRLNDEQIIEKTGQYIDDGTLTPEEALMRRRALDRQKKKYSTNFRTMRQEADEIAKVKSADADAAYSQAIKSDALRRPLPVNKYGGTSIFKTTLGSLSGIAPVVAMSPFVQGMTATGAGMAFRGARKILKPVADLSLRVGPALGAVVSGAENAAKSGVPKRIFNSVKNFKDSVAPDYKGNNGYGNEQSAGQKIEIGSKQVSSKRILTRREAKIPTREILLDFLRKAKGNKDLARKMALSEGYDISKQGEK